MSPRLVCRVALRGTAGPSFGGLSPILPRAGNQDRYGGGHVCSSSRRPRRTRRCRCRRLPQDHGRQGRLFRPVLGRGRPAVSVELTRDSGIATLTFSDPPVNLYSLRLHEEFDVALEQVEADPPRVLVIRAEGKIVSGGVDVSEFNSRGSRETTKELYDRMLELPDRVEALPIPTIFAAHSLTLTWAFEVALACDLLLASEKARFGLVERVIGLTPTMGGTQRLASRAGVARAKEFVFTGAQYDAAMLERWNVVNRVYGVDSFEDDVRSFAEGLADGPTKAFGAAKDILRQYEAGGVPAANAATTSVASALFDTEDLRHGMESFLADGPGNATFHGR
ncbi:enoyl-CoA hydratase/isomerase family protein [Aeromicrobium sp. YIM 150415]|nr:enoyl-CoA hydratase/isomerase family protein [Aeromicrobium sp. YIM 150415]